MYRSSLAVAGLFAAEALAGGYNVYLPPDGTFDYIVVGGGPAGLTVANRLTEDPNINVLLLEAGRMDQGEQRITVPAFQGSAGFNFGSCGGYNWCDQTVPQTNLLNRNITIPQGFGVGGGTLINAMLWNRGDTQDYDAWASLGNPGWDWNGLLRYFQKTETFTGEANATVRQQYGIGEDRSQHGYVGPQNVTFPRFKYTPSINFFAAMNGLGIPTQLDPANPPQKGAMWLPQGMSPWNQSRADARRARWDPVQNRPNFWISDNQHVFRVMFAGGCATPANGGPLRAVGIESAQFDGGYVWRATANREVILAAGALRSPQLLELSGIGGQNILNGLGLTTRVSLPGVGNNLQDHMLMHMGQGFDNTSYVYSNILLNATVSAAAQQLYYANRTGPWTFGPPDGNAFLSLPQFSNRASQFSATAAGQGPGDYLAPGLDPTVVAGFARHKQLLAPALADPSRGAIEFLQSNEGGTQISNMRPLTRGTVHAQSTNPFTYPRLDMRYASNPVDYNMMFDALRWNDRLFQQPAIKIMQPFQFAPFSGGSDSDYQLFMNQSLGTEFHPSGTAAMQPRNLGGVVDPNLIVYGTANLRVVDASIQPLIPATHMESAVYAVAEKAADIIKAGQSTIPRIVPATPLDASRCTLPNRKRDLDDTEPGFVYQKRQNDYSDNSLVPQFYGGYPNYDNTPSMNPPADHIPASKQLPKGAGFRLADNICKGVQGELKGVLGEIDDIVGGIFGATQGPVSYGSAPSSTSSAPASSRTSSTSSTSSSSSSSAPARPSGYSTKRFAA